MIYYQIIERAIKPSEIEMKRGRPQLPTHIRKVAKSIKLPPYLFAWLERQPKSRGVLIEQAVVEKHQIDVEAEIALLESTINGVDDE